MRSTVAAENIFSGQLGISAFLIGSAGGVIGLLTQLGASINYQLCLDIHLVDVS